MLLGERIVVPPVTNTVTDEQVAGAAINLNRYLVSADINCEPTDRQALLTLLAAAFPESPQQTLEQALTAALG